MGSTNDDDSSNSKVFGLEMMMKADAIPKMLVSKMLETTERFVPEYTRTYKSRAKSKRTLRSREDYENC